MANLLFYSTNSYLSYLINQQFYKGKHYVWCSPVFDPKSLGALDPLKNIASSSSPHDIFIGYRDSVNSCDDHSDFIERNKRGIKRGASIMLADGKIDENQYQMINYWVDKSTHARFKPLLYIIPANAIAEKLRPVPLEEAANPLGPEYRIFDLEATEFEIIEFNK